MGIVGEDLVSDRIHHLSIIVLGEVEFDQLVGFERGASYGVGAVLLQPWENVGDVEYGAVGTADRVVERLQRNGAEVERQALEGGDGGIRLGCAGASARRIGIFRGPLAVSNLSVTVSEGPAFERGKWIYVELIGS